jgi:hypothetical protein
VGWQYPLWSRVAAEFFSALEVIHQTHVAASGCRGNVGRWDAVGDGIPFVFKERVRLTPQIDMKQNGRTGVFRHNPSRIPAPFGLMTHRPPSGKLRLEAQPWNFCST